jgi:hypothetical protein
LRTLLLGDVFDYAWLLRLTPVFDTPKGKPCSAFFMENNIHFAVLFEFYAN